MFGVPSVLLAKFSRWGRQAFQGCDWNTDHGFPLKREAKAYTGDSVVSSILSSITFSYPLKIFLRHSALIK